MLLDGTVISPATVAAAEPRGLRRRRACPIARRNCPASARSRAVEITRPRQRPDVGGMVRREVRCELNDHPPLRQLHVERVLGIERAPVGSRRLIQDFLHRPRWRCGLFSAWRVAPARSRTLRAPKPPPITVPRIVSLPILPPISPGNALQRKPLVRRPPFRVSGPMSEDLTAQDRSHAAPGQRRPALGRSRADRGLRRHLQRALPDRSHQGERDLYRHRRLHRLGAGRDRLVQVQARQDTAHPHRHRRAGDRVRRPHHSAPRSAHHPDQVHLHISVLRGGNPLLARRSSKTSGSSSSNTSSICRIASGTSSLCGGRRSTSSSRW